MKAKPPILLSAVFVFLVLFTPYTLSSQPASNCKSIQDEIASLQNQIAALEKSKETALEDEEMGAARTAMSALSKLISNLQNNPFVNPGGGQSDKEHVLKMMQDAFIYEENYSSNRPLLDPAIAKDFDQNGKLIGTRPVNTINALKQIRSGLEQFINSSSDKDTKAGIEDKIEELKNKIKADQQRLAALNCESKKPSKDNADDKKSLPPDDDPKTACDKNQKRINELKNKLIGLYNEERQKGIWDDEKLARTKTYLSSSKRLLSELSRYPATSFSGKKQEFKDLQFIDEQLVPIVSSYGDYKKYRDAFNKDVQGEKLVKGRMENTIWYIESMVYSIETEISNATRERTNNPDAIALQKQIDDVNREMSDCNKKMEQLKCKQLTAATEKKTEIKPETKPENKTVSKPDGPPPLPETIELTEHFDKYGNYSITLKRKEGITYEGVYNNGKKGVFRLTTYHDNVFKLQRDYYADYASTQIYLGNYKPGSASGTIVSGGTFYASLK